MTQKITVLAFQEAGCWVTQALEYDVAAQGESVRDALDNLVACLVAHVQLALRRSAVPFGDIPRAPTRLFDLADKAWPLEMPEEEKRSWGTLNLDPHLRVVVGVPDDGSFV